jgi:hypothetical protein
MLDRFEKWPWPHEKVRTGDRDKFVSEVILKDLKARQFNTRRFHKMQTMFPGTTNDQFSAWIFQIWSQWVRLKLKGLKKRREWKQAIDSSRELSLNPNNGPLFRQESPTTFTNLEPHPPTQSLPTASIPTRLPESTLQFSLATKRSNESLEPAMVFAEPKRQRLVAQQLETLRVYISDGVLKVEELENFVNEIKTSGALEMDMSDVPERFIHEDDMFDGMEGPVDNWDMMDDMESSNKPELPAGTAITSRSISPESSPRLKSAFKSSIEVTADKNGGTIDPRLVGNIDSPPCNTSNNELQIPTPTAITSRSISPESSPRLKSAFKSSNEVNTAGPIIDPDVLQNLTSRTPCASPSPPVKTLPRSIRRLKAIESESESQEDPDSNENLKDDCKTPSSSASAHSSPEVYVSKSDGEEDKDRRDDEDEIHQGVVRDVLVLSDDHSYIGRMHGGWEGIAADSNVGQLLDAAQNNRIIFDVNSIPSFWPEELEHQHGDDGDDGDDDSVIEVARQTPPPDEECIFTDSDDESVRRIKRMYLSSSNRLTFFRRAGLMDGTEMEHKEMRHFWKEEYTPALKGSHQLKPWQKIGVTFFHYLQDRGLPGGMLCDEMGIGKVLPKWLTHGANFRRSNRFRSFKQTTKYLKVTVRHLPPNVWQTWSYGITPPYISWWRNFGNSRDHLETLAKI